jgi:hypothetical protein
MIRSRLSKICARTAVLEATDIGADSPDTRMPSVRGSAFEECGLFLSIGQRRSLGACSFTFRALLFSPKKFLETGKLHLNALLLNSLSSSCNCKKNLLHLSFYSLVRNSIFFNMIHPVVHSL